MGGLDDDEAGAGDSAGDSAGESFEDLIAEAEELGASGSAATTAPDAVVKPADTASVGDSEDSASGASGPGTSNSDSGAAPRRRKKKKISFV